MKSKRMPKNHPTPARPQHTPAPKHPVLQQLAELYPNLFGNSLRPLKRGIYNDLLQAHPETLPAEDLKTALSQHTRSTRYLIEVSKGTPRHDLQEQAVEDMAPEHVLHALLEIHRRRQPRHTEDLRPQLQKRIAQAFLASGLSTSAYAALLPIRDPEIQTLLHDALEQASAQTAKDAALYRAYQASGLSPDTFANNYGLTLGQVQRMLQRMAREPATTN